MSSFPQPEPSWDPHQPTHQFAAVSPDERNWSVAAHLASFVTAWFAFGLVAPLVVLLVKGKSSPFIRRHAIESLNFQINALAYGALLAVLLFLLVGLLLLPLVPIYLIFYGICVILGTVRASHGQEFRYPLTVRVIS